MVALDQLADNIIITKCDFCGKDIKITKERQKRNKHFFCNAECSKLYKKKDQIKIQCKICGKDVYRKKSQVEKMKHPENITCSKECCYKLRKTTYSGENNHQYGLTGNKNASWKSDERYNNDNKRYTLIRVENHPFCDQQNFVPEHRLIAEKYLLNEQNSIEIDGILYLKPECVVHHIDFNKKNNDVKNLYVFESESIHTLFHNLYKSKRINSLEEFLTYYQSTYVNKLYNYQWLYKAYVEYDLSINQISKLFNIPYNSVKTEIYKTELDVVKKNNKTHDLLINLIVQDLLNFKQDEVFK